MKKTIYDEYLRIVDLALKDNNDLKFNKDLIESDDTNEITITVKDYKVKKGLSSLLHRLDHVGPYMFKGPLGKGLLLE